MRHLCLTVLLLVAACGGVNSTNPTASEITLTVDSVLLPDQGDQLLLQGQVLDESGQPMNGVGITWTSADIDVAAVDNTGLVTAVGQGSTKITAFAGAATKAVPVRVGYHLLGWMWAEVQGLVVIDPATGATQTLLEGIRLLECLAFDPVDRKLYGVENLSSDNVLVSIDTRTGTLSDVGVIEGFQEITACSYDTDSRSLFAFDQTTHTLLRINPAAGGAEVIGSHALGAVNAMAIRPSDGQVFLDAGVDPASLVVLDKVNGAFDLVGQIGEDVIVVSGMSFNPWSGQLFGTGQYGPSSVRGLLRIDSETAAVETVGPPHGQIVGMTFAW